MKSPYPVAKGVQAPVTTSAGEPEWEANVGAGMKPRNRALTRITFDHFERLVRPAKTCFIIGRHSTIPSPNAVWLTPDALQALMRHDDAALHQHGPADGRGRRESTRPRRAQGSRGPLRDIEGTGFRIRRKLVDRAGIEPAT